MLSNRILIERRGRKQGHCRSFDLNMTPIEKLTRCVVGSHLEI